MKRLDQFSRAGVSIVALVILVILLVAQTLNQAHENERLQRGNAEKLEVIKAQSEKQIGDLAGLLALVQTSAEAAAAAGRQPAVTLEQAVKALEKAGFTKEAIDQAVQRASKAQGPSGPPGPQGPQGPAGAGATTSTVPATTTSTTRPSATTTSTTTTTVPPTTTTTRCLVSLGLVKIGC